MRDSRGRTRPPRPVSGLIGDFRDRFGPRDLVGLVQGAWPEVVGETIAAVTRIAGESEGTVEIECESAVWAEELSLMEPRLKGLLNDRLGDEGPVQGLRFRPVQAFRGEVRKSK
jgi:predicted nucleic acid-binding Zn ribbon protein